MRRPILFGLLLCVAVAACADRRPSETSEAPAPATTEAASDDAVETSADADFVGVWAPTPAQCARNQTWRLTSERLAAIGVSCAIEGAARSANGWSLQAICTGGGGAPAGASLTLTRTGEPLGSSVTIEGGPFTPPVTLVRCTPPLSGAPAN